MTVSPRLLLLELNEVNFEMVDTYARDGALPNFRRLFDEHGFCETRSETEYENIEPWIQWVTAHTGLSLEQHGVFRLGDVTSRKHEQIWERLEREYGLRTGALSPMNATNRSKDPAFFVPDPWTPVDLVAPAGVERLFRAIQQIVNDNADGRITPRSALALVEGLLRYARPANYLAYLEVAAKAVRQPWGRAMLLDQLLADLFMREVQRTHPDFASLFLNAGAHIQHHYFFNSKLYDGKQTNPSWYVSASSDPVFEIYGMYDRILGQLGRAFPEARLMVATGLHQVPHHKATYYWRLRDHESFLRKCGVAFETVEPRMSRDFLINCKDGPTASNSENRLNSARAADGLPLFEVDNRGDSLFVMLTYPSPIDTGFAWTIGEDTHHDLHSDVSFVAIKNGQHDGTGYFLDTGIPEAKLPPDFPLAELPDRILEAVTA